MLIPSRKCNIGFGVNFKRQGLKTYLNDQATVLSRRLSLPTLIKSACLPLNSPICLLPSFCETQYTCRQHNLHLPHAENESFSLMKRTQEQARAARGKRQKTEGILNRILLVKMYLPFNAVVGRSKRPRIIIIQGKGWLKPMTFQQKCLDVSAIWVKIFLQSHHVAPTSITDEAIDQALVARKKLLNVMHTDKQDDAFPSFLLKINRGLSCSKIYSELRLFLIGTNLPELGFIQILRLRLKNPSTTKSTASLLYLMLGLFYQHSTDEKIRDENLVYTQFINSAELGNSYGQYFLGLWYYELNTLGPVYRLQGIEWIHKAAEQKNPAAFLKLGLWYGYESGFRNYRKSLILLKKASCHGNFSAQIWLGFKYQRGFGDFGRDLHKAIEWFRRAGRNGNSYAYIMLGGILSGPLKIAKTNTPPPPLAPAPQPLLPRKLSLRPIPDIRAHQRYWLRYQLQALRA
ncbi:hypothetical protein G9A89_019645 [Geosiphon pyriformis]|nr:hypothetical protein G9A89_019645 [Geosiphon pyriformis]